MKILQNIYLEIFKHAFVIGAGLASAGAVVYTGVQVAKKGAIKFALEQMAGKSGKAEGDADGVIDVSADD